MIFYPRVGNLSENTLLPELTREGRELIHLLAGLDRVFDDIERWENGDISYKEFRETWLKFKQTWLKEETK